MYTGPEMVEPPDLMKEIAKQNISGRALSRELGIGLLAARRLREGKKLPRSQVEAVVSNLAGKDEAFRLTTLSSLDKDMLLDQRVAFIRRVRAMAHIVQEFGKLFDMNRLTLYYYVFSPKKEIAEFCTAMKHAKAMLTRMHKECPELDRRVFAHAKELLKELKRKEKDNGTNLVSDNELPEVQNDDDGGVEGSQTDVSSKPAKARSRKPGGRAVSGKKRTDAGAGKGRERTGDA